MNLSASVARRPTDFLWVFLCWAPAAWIAAIFVWYLQYKFTDHPGSTYLFTILTDWLGFHGHEKVMRIGTGALELIASVLLFIRPTQLIGAALAWAIMTGAIFFHLASPLGIDPYNDGGVLFKQAISVWVSALVVLWVRRAEVRPIARALVRWLNAVGRAL